MIKPSDGEIHFLWHFIQGSIMIPSTRWSLRRNWGMCDRHSFGFIAVEAAYRRGYLHGQAVLYKDLMERAAAAFKAPAPLQAVNVALKLRETEPCLMCKLGYVWSSVGEHRRTGAHRTGQKFGTDSHVCARDRHVLARARVRTLRG
ncbi:MAG: hypothetical protein A2Z04_06485 [Chloroflexi bacterium RBG_16_57_9]|nr:MAG: hypothetical protein A2Z04_06485 [Chloroflexi bacterium RBG_16_57_9]